MNPLNLYDIQMDFPAAAVLLLLTPLFLYLYYRYYIWKKRVSRLFVPPATKQDIVFGTTRRSLLHRCLLLSLAWFFTVLALMGPKGNPRYPEEDLAGKKNNQNQYVKKESSTVIFLIDTSSSMAVKDSDQGKSRLDKAVELADEVAAQLEGDTAALYAFTSRATPVVPPTIDYLFFRLMLSQLTYNEGDIAGTNFQETFRFLREQMASEIYERAKIILLFTDGGDTIYESAQGEGRTQREKQIMAALGSPAKYNYRLFVVGMGSKSGGEVPQVTFQGKPVSSRLQDDLLKKISLQGKGRYWAANQSPTLQLSAEIGEKIQEKAAYIDAANINLQAGGVSTVIYDYYFQYPLLIALLFFLGGLAVQESRYQEPANA